MWFDGSPLGFPSKLEMSLGNLAGIGSQRGEWYIWSLVSQDRSGRSKVFIDIMVAAGGI